MVLAAICADLRGEEIKIISGRTPALTFCFWSGIVLLLKGFDGEETGKAAHREEHNFAESVLRMDADGCTTPEPSGMTGTELLPLSEARAASCHASPARDVRFPSDSGWCPGHAALPSPSLRSIRTARDGLSATCKQGGTVEYNASPLRKTGVKLFFAPKPNL